MEEVSREQERLVKTRTGKREMLKAFRTKIIKQKESIHHMSLEAENCHRDIVRLQGTIETTKKVCNAYRNNCVS